MNIIKKSLLVFFSSLALIFLVSVFLPSDYEISRISELNCDKSKVYYYLNDINNLDSWFYITSRLDSTIDYKFNNDTVNGKSSVEWNGDYMGQGVFEFTNFQNEELIEFKISFENNSVTKSGKLLLSSITENKTKLKWVDYGENGWNPVHRIFGLFIDNFLGPDMEKSIKRIKKNLDC